MTTQKPFTKMSTIERREYVAGLLGKPLGQLLTSDYRRMEAEILRKEACDAQAVAPTRRLRPYQMTEPLVVDGMRTDSPEWLALPAEERIIRARRAMKMDQ